MGLLNFLSLAGIFGLCAIAWLFSENRKIIPWRVIIWGIGLQLIMGFLVFRFPLTKFALNAFSNLLNGVFIAADDGARFVFGPLLIPKIGEAPIFGIGTIFAFRVLPTVIFFGGLMALLYNIGVIQPIVNFFAKVFYATMRLSGAEAMSGAANIFVGIEAAIVVKPFLAKMTRSELCAILACCFGTAASSTLAIYVRALEGVFPNILVHLVSASIIAIPACFVLSKIVVPETGVPVTAGGIPQENKQRKSKKLPSGEPNGTPPAAPETRALGAIPDSPRTRIQSDDEETETLTPPPRPRNQNDGDARPVPPPPPPPGKFPLKDEVDAPPNSYPPQETVAGEPVERVSPMDAAILGAIDGMKMAVTIAAVLIFILGLVSLINQIFGVLASFKGSDNLVLQSIGQFFSVVTLQNILGALFLPLTFLTAVSDNWDELWRSSVIIGRRLFETAIPPYQTLGQEALKGAFSPRAILVISYALSGFAHLASVGIFVGGTIALIPSRRKDITDLGWKALFVGTLATMMIASVAGVFDNGDPSILGIKQAPNPAISPAPSPTLPIPGLASPSPTVSPTASPTVPAASPSPAGSPTASPSPQASTAPQPSPTASAKAAPLNAPKTPVNPSKPPAVSSPTPKATKTPVKPLPTPTGTKTPAG
ncbi:MAG: nucleoside:proton symporter [Scytolyngbya sp. HA4215-MV1]|jgi:CNT family concentrative nucleoside transporter|nr:nucleoside:proton symporter [Scytolyngbya sp. HA4215-MV1]